MQALSNYLPDNSFEHVVSYIHQFKVHLTVTKKRKSVLGDYRHAELTHNHRISINGNLNKYEFLITLLHELAHLLTFEQYKHKVEAHGMEWKHCYSMLLKDFVQLNIFPDDIKKALQKSIRNPSATANGETELLLVLRKYNPIQQQGIYTLHQLPVDTIFVTENGRVFKKGIQRRKRIVCIEIKTGLNYLFSPIVEVKKVEL